MAMSLNRIVIKYNLTFATPFHCGSGLRDGLIDRSIVRDHDNYLYVPGSTIKGVVREHCEHLARMYTDDSTMNDLIVSPHDTQKALLAFGPRITMITRIFGSHYRPGLLFFEDATQSADDKKEYERGGQHSLQTDLYTQVRLDRPTRTAVSGALYTSEFGIRDVTLHGSINGWLRCTPIAEINQGPTYSLLLLLAGLHLLDRIGGNKSAGKGKCRCEIETVKIDDKSFSKKDWQDWFEHLDALSGYTGQATYQEEDEEV